MGGVRRHPTASGGKHGIAGVISIQTTRQDMSTKSDRTAASLIHNRWVERLSLCFVAWAEKWCPDAYVFVLAASVIVAFAAIAHGGHPVAVSKAFGDGFWSIIPLTMQIAMAAITGYVLAMSPPVSKLLRSTARLPRTSRGAVVFVGVLSIALSLVNWSFSLVYSGLLVREIARREDMLLDYRAAGAAGYLGLGCGFTLGISSPAAQLQATPGSIPAALMRITGVIGFNETIFTWQTLVIVLLVTAVSAFVCYVTSPADGKAKTAKDLGIDLNDDRPVFTRRERTGDYLEFSPILSLGLIALSAGWLWDSFKSGNPFIAMSQLNNYNFVFLLLAIVLHWYPRSFLDSFRRAMPSVAGVMLQFPFYGGISYMLTKVANAGGHTLSDSIAQWFVSFGHGSFFFSVLVGLYSSLLGFLVPSAGGKWVVEAPYVMSAANQLHAHLGWTVMVFNIAETLPNLINPFWMLPLLGILKLRSKDLAGFTAIQFLIHFPIAIVVAACLMSTFTYHPAFIPSH
jgi:short-chain fatty acids transporter